MEKFKNCKFLELWWVFPIWAITVLMVLFIFSRFGFLPLVVTSTVTQKTDIFQVTGEGKVVAKPDMAEVTVGVEKTGGSIKDLQNEVNKTVNNLVADLKKLGIEERYIKTTSYNVHPNHDWSSGRQRITGYTVFTQLQIKTKNLDKINEVIDTATAGGLNQVYGLSLTINEEKRKELEKEARQQAVKEAKTKSEELARVSGIKLGKIINVTESLATPWLPQNLAMEKLAVGGGTPTEIQPGESEIRVTLTLSYQVL